HDRGEPGDGAGPQVVTVGEAPGEDDGVHLVEVAVGVPDELGLAAEVPDGLDDVELAVGPREGDDADPRRHQTTSTAERVTSAASITGLIRNRWQTSSTSARAAASSAASSVNRIDLPTRTSLMPSKPRA